MVMNFKGGLNITTSRSSRLSSAELIVLIQEFLDSKKAIDIITIDLSDKSSIADYLVIASGQSSRQVGSMAELLIKNLKSYGEMPTVEGIAQCEWVLVDVGDVVVHLFRPEVRSFYNLEKMWEHKTNDKAEHNVA